MWAAFLTWEPGGMKPQCQHEKLDDAPKAEGIGQDVNQPELHVRSYAFAIFAWSPGESEAQLAL